MKLSRSVGAIKRKEKATRKENVATNILSKLNPDYEKIRKNGNSSTGISTEKLFAINTSLLRTEFDGNSSISVNLADRDNEIKQNNQFINAEHSAEGVDSSVKRDENRADIAMSAEPRTVSPPADSNWILVRKSVSPKLNYN